MTRIAESERKTTETDIFVKWNLEGTGQAQIETGIPFFNHMLNLFCAHGRFDLTVRASGDIAVDFHHTVEDVGLVMGGVLKQCLGDRYGIMRYGHSVVPMDETLGAVAIDLSNRPYLVWNLPPGIPLDAPLSASTAKEFFRAFSNAGGMNLHINVAYGENGHHILEAIFKALGRALHQATTRDPNINVIPSTKGML